MVTDLPLISGKCIIQIYEIELNSQTLQLHEVINKSHSSHASLLAMSLSWSRNTVVVVLVECWDPIMAHVMTAVDAFSGG